MKTDTSKIEIRSAEVQDILGKPPRKIVRHGITVIFSVIVLVLIGSWFFKYPDIINAQITLTTENPPVSLNAMATGKISNLFYSENQQVIKNTCVAIIENTADYKDVEQLQKILQNAPEQLPSKHLKLGELQSAYSNYLRLLQSYQTFQTIDYHKNKADAIEKQKEDYKKYSQLLTAQLHLQKQELTLAKQQLEREKILFGKNVIAKADYEKAQKSYLQQQSAYESAKANLANNQMQINTLSSQLIDLNLQKHQETDRHKTVLQEALNNLKSALKKWEQTYLLISPIDGKVTFTRIWSKNQYVKMGETVAVIIPNDSTHIIGKLEIPAKGIGKVKVGQTVNIKFDNFPHMEFGLLRGKVKNLSLVPVFSEQGAVYTANIALPDTLVSNYGTNIVFSQQMTGIAEIITEDLRLLQRFFNPLKSIWKKNIK